jgi:hypothetical protein
MRDLFGLCLAACSWAARLGAKKCNMLAIYLQWDTNCSGQLVGVFSALGFSYLHHAREHKGEHILDKS